MKCKQLVLTNRRNANAFGWKYGIHGEVKKKSEERTKKEIANEKTQKNAVVLNLMESHSQTF